MQIRKRLEDGTFGPLEGVFEAEKSAEVLALEQRLEEQALLLDTLMFEILPSLLETETEEI